MSVAEAPISTSAAVATAPGEAAAATPADGGAGAGSRSTVATMTTTTTAHDAEKGALLARVIDVLDRDGLAYCILHGYETFPHRVPGDVDLLVPREMVPRRLAELLRAAEGKIGAKVVQWFNDRAHLIVLCAPAAAPGAAPARPDARPRCPRAGRAGC
ncbi:MAG TPA: hypothetical protein VER17_21360 [Tepidisphaeraceae bacterium]|nr:hypothetical protein [Tepidisphaeraceae bacterium]